MFYLAVGLIIMGILLLGYGLIGHKMKRDPLDQVNRYGTPTGRRAVRNVFPWEYGGKIDPSRPAPTTRRSASAGASRPPVSMPPAPAEEAESNFAESFLNSESGGYMPGPTQPVGQSMQELGSPYGPAAEMPVNLQQPVIITASDVPSVSEQTPASEVPSMGRLPASSGVSQPRVPTSSADPAVTGASGVLFLDKGQELAYTGQEFESDAFDPASLNELKRVGNGYVNVSGGDFLFRMREANYVYRHRQLARVIFYPNAFVLIPREEGMPIPVFLTSDGARIKEHLKSLTI